MVVARSKTGKQFVDNLAVLRLSESDELGSSKK